MEAGSRLIWFANIHCWSELFVCHCIDQATSPQKDYSRQLAFEQVLLRERLNRTQQVTILAKFNDSKHPFFSCYFVLYGLLVSIIAWDCAFTLHLPSEQVDENFKDFAVLFIVSYTHQYR